MDSPGKRETRAHSPGENMDTRAHLSTVPRRHIPQARSLYGQRKSPALAQDGASVGSGVKPRSEPTPGRTGRGA